MNKPELPETDFTPLKRPEKPKESKQLDRVKYLDELYSEKWLDEYFNSQDRPKSKE
jgi:hypothetical protein